MNRACEDIAASNGITLAEFNVLLVLGEGEPLSSAQLARRTFVTPQAGHQVVSGLERRGLISSGKHPTNRRVRLVRLSEEGTAVLAECRRQLHEFQQRAMSELSPADRDRLPRLLIDVADTLKGGWFGDADAEAAASARRANRRA